MTKQARHFQLYGLLLMAILAIGFPGTAIAFTPHPDCTFNKIDPLPELVDCTYLDNRLKNIQNSMFRTQKAMDMLRQEHGEAIDDLIEQGYAQLVGDVTGLPTSAEGAIALGLEFCKKKLGMAVGTVNSLVNATSTFSEGINAAVLWRRFNATLEELKASLKDADSACAECHKKRLESAVVLDEALKYNQAGVPKYPADHPLCKPPEEDEPEVERKEDVPGSESDPQNGDDGASGAVHTSGDDRGAVTPPDWSKLDSMTYSETKAAQDWMSSELDGCEKLGSASCVNLTLQNQSLLLRHIDRMSRKSQSSAEKMKWQELRLQNQSLRIRGNNKTR